MRQAFYYVMKSMNRLLLTLLALAYLAGCATIPFVSAPPPNPPGDQVVVLAHSQYRFKMYGEMLCDVTVKNAGQTDVKNITFLLDMGGGKYKSTVGAIDFLPARETITFTISTKAEGVFTTEEEAIKAARIVVDQYDIVSTAPAASPKPE